LALTDKYIFTSSSNKNIKIWSVNINNKYKYKIKNKKSINKISLSKNKKYLSILRDDNKILLYNLKNNKLIKKLKGNAISVFSNSNKKLATVLGIDKIIIYSIKKNNKIESRIYFKNNKEFIVSLLFINDNKLAIGTSSGNIHILDLKNDKVLNILKSKYIINRINSMALTINKKYLIATGFNKNIDIWNLATMKYHKTIFNKDLENCAFIIDDNNLLTSGKDKTIKLWNFNKLKIKKIFKGNRDWTDYLELSPNHKDFITISDDNTLKFWTLNKDSYLLSFKLKNLRNAIFKDDKTLIVTQKNKIFFYPFVFNDFYHNKEYYEKKSQLKLVGFNIIAK
jgi:WD40 repeat protein